MPNEKCFTQRFMEGFGLEFPKDADRFVEILERFDDQDGTLGQLFDDVIDALPEKMDRILGFTI